MWGDYISMPIYSFLCRNCGLKFDKELAIDYRYLPEIEPCGRCLEYDVIKVPTIATIRVPEGNCGNAANGYSSTHGDAENFKARARGEKEPYKK